MSDTTPIPQASERELLPCPFCGMVRSLKVVSAEELANEGDDDQDPWEHSDSYAVVCDASRPDGPGGCGAQGGFKLTVTEAIENWNTRAALSHPSTPQGWQPISTAPEAELVVVGWLDSEDTEHPERHDFDWLEEGLWQKHSADHEHFLMVAPPGSRGPSENAPYTHWQRIGAIPAPPEQGGKG
jgi:hypothetical protein